MLMHVRRVAALMAAMAQSRIELAGIELGEALDRVLVDLVLTLVGCLLLMLALVTLSVLLVLWCGEAQRPLALALLSLLYLGAGGGLLLHARARSRAGPPLLAVTLAELKKDARALGHFSSDQPSVP